MELKAKLNNIFTDQIVGGSVVLIKGNEEIKYSYGYSSLVDKKLVEEETIYRIASISKVIIGMAAMKLVEEGKLNLDEDISNILGFKIRNPKYPSIPITTRMLMLHKSSITDGLEDESVEIGYNGVNGKHYFVSLEDLLLNKNSKYYTDETYSNNKPGDKYLYSNFGSGIIACIIEKCSGKLFTEFVEEKFLIPLNMDASFKANKILKQEKISDTFKGFNTNRTAKSFIEGTYPDHPLGENFRGPAGGLFVSMQDLSKIMIALMNDGKYKEIEILKKEVVDELFVMNFFAKREYLEKNLTLFGYTGGAYGVSSIMFFSKERKAGICFIANGGYYKPASTGLNNIQEAMISILIDEIS